MTASKRHAHEACRVRGWFVLAAVVAGTTWAGVGVTPASATHTPPCPGRGLGGERVQNVYLETLDNSPDYAAHEERIMDELLFTDQLLDYSAGPQLNQDVRWECSSGAATVDHIRGGVIDQWWGRFWDDSTPATLGSEIDPTSEEAHLMTVDWNNRAVTGSTDTWNARIEGGFHPVATGEHTFYVTADDGVRVALTGRRQGCPDAQDADGICFYKSRIIDEWRDQGPTEYVHTEYLYRGGSAGRDHHYELEIEYYQGGGGNLLKVEYAPPGGTRQVIPASVTDDDCMPFSEAVSAIYDDVTPNSDEIVVAHVESGTEYSDTCDGSGATSGNIGGIGGTSVSLSVVPERYIHATAHELWHVIGGPSEGLTRHCTDFADADGVLDCDEPEVLDTGDSANDPGRNDAAHCYVSILDCGKNNYYSVAAPRGWPNRWENEAYNTSTSPFLDTTGGTEPECLGVQVGWGEEGNDTNSTLGGARSGVATLDGSDNVTGDAAANRYCLGDGADVFYAGAGGDFLVGGAGNDNLRGQDGGDQLYDGPGADLVYGGTGTDTWYRCPDDTPDTYSSIEVFVDGMQYCYPENFDPRDSSLSRLRATGDIE